jgi:hypothetical protein
MTERFRRIGGEQVETRDPVTPDKASLAAKKNEPPPELTKDVIINLAGMTPLQYAQQLAREAKKYKTPVKLLDAAVKEARAAAADGKLL